MRQTTLEDGLAIIFREFLTGLNTCFPALVTAFDGKNKVSVQPAIMMRQTGGIDVPLPTIDDVPILFPGSGGGFSQTHPINPGDPVLVICAQRAIDQWKTLGGVVSAGNLRRFDPADAIAIGGLSSFANAAPAGPDWVLSGLVAGEIRMSPTGTVTINGHLEVLP